MSVSQASPASQEIDFSVSATDVLYVGWRGKIQEDVLGEPTLTKTERGKDPAQQQQRLQEKREERAESLGICPFAFAATEIVVLRGDSPTPVFSAKKNASARLVQWLTKEYDGYFGRWLSSVPTNDVQGVAGKRGVAFVGFEVRKLLRAVCMEVLQANAEGASIPTEVPVRLWYSPSNVYDTADVLMGLDSHQKALSMPAVARRLRFPEQLCAPEACDDPLMAAMFSRAMAQRLQLFSFE